MEPDEGGEFYFLDVSLQFDDYSSIVKSKEIFKTCILQGLEAIFGEVGTCVPIDVVNYSLETNRGTLRCPASFYVRFRAALTLTGEYKNQICCFNVHKASKNLKSLTSTT